MKFVTCSGCGKAQPADGSCIWCGAALSAEGAQEPVIRKNAAAAFAETEQAVAAGNFRAARGCAERLALLLPDTASAYWLRCLTFHECRNAAELLAQGVSAANDPDFDIAFNAAEGTERKAYETLASAADTLRKALVKALRALEIRELQDKDILNYRKQAEERTAACRQKLAERYAALEAAERAVLELETDGTVLLYEFRQAQKESESEIVSIEKEAAMLNSPSRSDARKFAQRIGTAVARSEMAARERDQMAKTHPWNAKSAELRKQLDEAAMNCAKAEDELKRLNGELKEKADSLEALSRKIRAAAAEAEQFRFAAGFALLGDSACSALLHEAGLTEQATANIRKGR